jgi:glutamyl-tRNA reductase
VRFAGLGVSHRTASIEVRERLAKAVKALPEAVRELRRGTTLAEICVVSTCNRVELYASGDAEPAALLRDLKQFLLSTTGLSPQELESAIYQHGGLDGLEHLFRVTCSLDSMVLGEPQILGQVKEAYQASAEAGGTGPQLGKIFPRAFQVAKRVRTETGISQNAVSMSFAAVELGREIFGSLEGKNVLLVGAGKMSALAARHLKSQGIAEIRVANRSFDRAEELAREVGGVASSLADLEMLLGKADIVISSTAAPGFVVTKALMQKVVRARRYRPILFVDLAVPRDIEPAVSDLEGAFVYDVDDLEGVVAENREARAKEAAHAEAIIREEIDAFVRWSRQQEVVPVIKALRDKGLSIAEAEAARALASLKDPRAEKAVRAMSAAIVNKMLHPVLTHLKERGADGDPAALAAAVVAMFDLELPDSAPTEPAAPAAEPGEAGAGGVVVSINRS